MSIFWDRLLLGSGPGGRTSIDFHLGGKISSSPFERVRNLTDKMREANSLSLPVEAGTKVSFLGGMGSYLSYEDPPVEGAVGEVVTVRSAGGEITHHEGKVFVQWEDGKFRSIHASHLKKISSPKKASSGKIPWTYMSERDRRNSAKYLTEEKNKAIMWDDEERLKEVEAMATRDGVIWKGDKYVPDTFDPARHEIRRKSFPVKVSNLGDLTQFLKVADGKLIHKSTKDLWSYSVDKEGNYTIARIFDDNGEPLKG